MKTCIDIGNEHFDTKGKAKARCREILDAYVGRDILPGADWDFVLALFENHPHFAEKQGTGVTGFRVVTEGPTIGKNASRHFEVVRSDGTTTDFSYEKCIDGVSKRADCLEAMRAAVADQLWATRVMAGGVDPDRHAHHAGITFNELASLWMKQEGLTFETVAVQRPADGIGKEMAYTDQMLSWYAFHQEHAELVAMDADTHRHLPKGPRNIAVQKELVSA